MLAHFANSKIFVTYYTITHLLSKTTLLHHQLPKPQNTFQIGHKIWFRKDLNVPGTTFTEFKSLVIPSRKCIVIQNEKWKDMKFQKDFNCNLFIEEVLDFSKDTSMHINVSLAMLLITSSWPWYPLTGKVEKIIFA